MFGPILDQSRLLLMRIKFNLSFSSYKVQNKSSLSVLEMICLLLSLTLRHQISDIQIIFNILTNQVVEDIQRERKYDRGVLLSTDTVQRLKQNLSNHLRPIQLSPREDRHYYFRFSYLLDQTKFQFNLEKKGSGGGWGAKNN